MQSLPLTALSVHHWLQRSGAQIVCHQETHASSDAELSSRFPFFSCMFSPGSVRNRGVAIFFKSSFALIQSRRDVLRRLVEADRTSSGSVLRVLSIYAPNRNPDRDSFPSVYLF